MYNTCCNACGGTTRQNNCCNTSALWVVTPVNAQNRTGCCHSENNVSTTCGGGLFNTLFPWSNCGWNRCGCGGYSHQCCGCGYNYNGCGCLYGNNSTNQVSACFGRCNRTYSGNGCGTSVNVLNANSTTETTDDYYVRQYKLNGTGTTASTCGCGCGCGCQF